MRVLCPICFLPPTRKAGKVKLERIDRNAIRFVTYQSYRCVNNHLFTPQHKDSTFTNSFIEYAVYAYLRCLSFNTTIQIVRAQFERDILSKKTLLELTERVADKLPSLTDVDNLFHPKRSGYLAFDGVYFKHEGDLFCLLTCFDPETFDIISYRLCEKENFADYEALCLDVKAKLERAKVPACGVYLDGEKGLISAVSRVFPGVPQQLCVVHKYLRMGEIVPFKSANRKGVFYLKKRAILKFKKLFEEVIFAKSKKGSVAKFAELDAFTRNHFIDRFYKGYRMLKNNFNLTLTHFDYPHMQRDNNLIECFNSIISRKFDLFKGFKKDGNIERYLKLAFLDFRFHKLSESRFAYRRDASPLELSRANIPTHYNFIKMLRVALNLNFED